MDNVKNFRDNVSEIRCRIIRDNVSGYWNKHSFYYDLCLIIRSGEITKGSYIYVKKPVTSCNRLKIKEANGEREN